MMTMKEHMAKLEDEEQERTIAKLQADLAAAQEQIGELEAAIDGRDKQRGDDLSLYADDVDILQEEIAKLEEQLRDALAESYELHAQLAEMRQLLQDCDQFIISRKPEHGGAPLVARIRKLLSAAPAVGQVLCRIRGGWDTEIYGEENPILWLPHKHANVEVKAVFGELDERHGEPVEAIIREAMPEEQGGE